MRAPAITAAACLLVAGCAAIDAQDRAAGSDFTPSADRTSFVYKGTMFRNDDSHARGWLNDWLRDNNMCPNGYKETSRDRVVTHPVIGGQAYRLTIAGKCV